MNVEDLAPGLAPHGHSISGDSEAADPSEAPVFLGVSGVRSALVRSSCYLCEVTLLSAGCVDLPLWRGCCSYLSKRVAEKSFRFVFENNLWDFEVSPQENTCYLRLWALGLVGLLTARFAVVVALCRTANSFACSLTVSLVRL